MLGLPENFFDSTALTCRILYQMDGLCGSLNGLLGIAREFLPLVRINALYAATDYSMFISMADTQPGSFLPTQVRQPGKEPPFLRPDMLATPLIINDLAPFKGAAFVKDYTTQNFPFLVHKALARIPLFSNGDYIFVLNFWSDTADAYDQEDLAFIQRLAAPLAKELQFSLSSIINVPAPEPLPPSISSHKQIAMCPGLNGVRKLVEQVAPTSSTVLLQGETGVGKELVANAVHELSARHNGPFVKINCGAIPETLLESELFGHERGSFTGAYSTRRGYFEEASGGTLFLDEIGEMPLSSQVSLLRVLDSKVIARVGGQGNIQVNVRIVAATNTDLLKKVREGAFRMDLWYRLAVFPIHVPPLRARKGDIPALTQFLMRKKSQLLDIPLPKKIPREEMDRLYSHDWPGNTRELEYLIERSLILTRSRADPASFHFDFGSSTGDGQLTRGLGQDWPTLEEMERRYIKAVLAETRGKLTGRGGATEILGIHYTTLRAHMQQMGLAASRYRAPSRARTEPAPSED
jgi:transcriptional regulator with GAF, ATPase, and Fis domain